MNELVKKVREDVKCATFGCEVEFSKEENHNFSHHTFSWLDWQCDENHTIAEVVTEPTTLFKYLRRLAALGELLDFDYVVGEDDAYAGSQHSHVAIPGTSLATDRNRLEAMNMLLCFADQMKRTDKDRFRTAVEYRARLDTVDADDDWGTNAEKSLPRNTKRYWVCAKDHGGVEVRLNENPAAYVLALLEPVCLSLAIRAPGTFSIDQDEVAEMRDESPSSITHAARRAAGNYKGFCQFALSVYAGMYGDLLTDTGPLTNRYEKLPVQILQAAIDGKSHIEIHKDIVLPVMSESRVFRSMMRKASV